MSWTRYLVTMLVAFAMLGGGYASQLDENGSASHALSALAENSAQSSDQPSISLAQAHADVVSGGPDNGEDDPSDPTIYAPRGLSLAQSQCKAVCAGPAELISRRRDAPFRARGPPMS